MSGRHQPTNGADSPDGLASLNGGGDDPPMEELPRANEKMVRQWVMVHRKPDWTEADVRSQVSQVLMADALGRAIHASRGPGLMIDMPKCTRVNKAGEVENVPYGYDDLAGAGYMCDCEAMALYLVEVMKQQQAEADSQPTTRIIVKGEEN